MTSSDVLDTCFNVQLVRAADLLIDDTKALLAALAEGVRSGRLSKVSTGVYGSKEEER